MKRNHELLRKIPKVDVITADPRFSGVNPSILTEAVRMVTEELRQGILDGDIQDIPPKDHIYEKVEQILHRGALASLRPVINGTGVILHTNLGRACLSQKAAQAAAEVAAGYSTLEYDLETGERGSRQVHVEELLCRLTGAESAMAVNNNAAAVLLVLSALAKGREVIISRGELVEIGGSFRVPEVMEQSGAILREVGTTNKTYIEDYIRAISTETGALLKVHTSNYRITGFAQSVSLKQLAMLGHERNIPVIEDLGSGALVPIQEYGIPDEPFASQSVEAGADIITFSGDKLLGGPQAGIILSKSKYIGAIRKHPLARAVRIDKMALAALEATLREYLDKTSAERSIPVLSMLCAPREKLLSNASMLFDMIKDLKGFTARVVQQEAPVGGGTAPNQMLPSYCIEISPVSMTVEKLEKSLRNLDTPIIGRVYKGCYYLDMRTLFEKDFPTIVKAFKNLFS